MSCAFLCVACLALAQSPTDKAARPPYELRAAIHEALRSSAPSARPDARQATPALIALYEEVRTDTKLDPEDRLRFQGLLRARLQALAKQLAAAPVAEKRPQSVDPPGDRPNGEILAQQGVRPGQVGQPGFGGGRGGANAGGSPRDNSQELIDLIQRTIAPTTWDIAGGPGTIRYYRPLHVLVIRQTGEVHGHIGGTLKNLRK